MVALTDRLDFVIGGTNAKKLEEHFGIRTVNDLVRYYPRKYSEGMTVRGEGDDLDLEEGEHVTFVDTITDTKIGDMKPVYDKKRKRMRYPMWLRVTLGDHRPKVTATFFNAKWMIEKLPTETRIMLSGEVKYFKGTMQLSPSGVSGVEIAGRQGDRDQVAEDDRRCVGRDSVTNCWRRSSAISSRSTPRTPRCRAGTSTPVCARSSTCSTRSTSRCRNRLCANTI